jgi:ABC-type multidrug transport system fused ATPase/permease subunit
MDSSVITALAALAGAAVGGVMTVFASWLTQHAQARTQWIAHNQDLRQELYREFIEQSSTVYSHALQNNDPDMIALMGLYAKLSRMRILSSATVVDSADRMLKKIVDTYLEPNKTFPELRQMTHSGLIDPLRDFSEACREEFRLRNSPFDR